jgi:hypothetical protein
MATEVPDSTEAMNRFRFKPAPIGANGVKPFYQAIGTTEPKKFQQAREDAKIKIVVDSKNVELADRFEERCRGHNIRDKKINCWTTEPTEDEIEKPESPWAMLKYGATLRIAVDLMKMPIRQPDIALKLFKTAKENGSVAALYYIGMHDALQGTGRAQEGSGRSNRDVEESGR